MARAGSQKKRRRRTLPLAKVAKTCLPFSVYATLRLTSRRLSLASFDHTAVDQNDPFIGYAQLPCRSDDTDVAIDKAHNAFIFLVTALKPEHCESRREPC
jgi:hypothetical protein